MVVENITLSLWYTRNFFSNTASIVLKLPRLQMENHCPGSRARKISTTLTFVRNGFMMVLLKCRSYAFCAMWHTVDRIFCLRFFIAKILVALEFTIFRDNCFHTGLNSRKYVEKSHAEELATPNNLYNFVKDNMNLTSIYYFLINTSPLFNKNARSFLL